MATPIPNNHASFTARELVATTAGTMPSPWTGVVRGVCTDTRSLEAEQLFVALSGDRFDGHDHLAAAADRGAALALVERDVSDPPLPVLRVASTLDALGALAALHLERWRTANGGRVAAITGSAGKTTTKTLLGALIENAAPGQVVVTAGNMNNRIGLPLTVFQLVEHGYAVLELGTNEPGEIAALAKIAKPDVALLTLIAAAHTEGLGDIDAVAAEKRALFDHLAPDSVAIGNVDDDRVAAALAACGGSERVGYGTSEHATYRVMQRSLVGLDRQSVEMAAPGRSWTMETPLLGAVGALACAGAVAAADALLGGELEVDAIDRGLRRGAGQLGDRMCPRGREDGTWVIDDSYNANPASCRASIETAHEVAAHLQRRLVLVLGEMRELGDRSGEEHRALGVLAAERGEVLLFVAGDASFAQQAAEATGSAAHFVADSTQAATLATKLVQPGDVVLVKGSRGVATERVVSALLSGTPQRSDTDLREHANAHNGDAEGGSVVAGGTK